MSDDITTKPVNLNEDDDFDPTLIDEEESEDLDSLTTAIFGRCVGRLGQAVSA